MEGFRAAEHGVGPACVDLLAVEFAVDCELQTHSVTDDQRAGGTLTGRRLDTPQRVSPARTDVTDPPLARAIDRHAWTPLSGEPKLSAT